MTKWINFGAYDISIPLSVAECQLEKNELKNLTLSLKSLTNLFFPKIYGITGIFTSFRKDVGTDQYVLRNYWMDTFF